MQDRDIGGNRVGSAGSYEQPVGTVVLVDGLLSFYVALGRTCFRFSPRRLSALVGAWMYPTILSTSAVCTRRARYRSLGRDSEGWFCRRRRQNRRHRFIL